MSAPCLIEHDNGMGAGAHPGGDFLQIPLHGLGVAAGQDKGVANAALGTGGAEDIGRLGALIMGRAGAGSAPRPASGDLVLLSDPRFVLPPKLYLGVRRKSGADRLQFDREVF